DGFFVSISRNSHVSGQHNGRNFSEQRKVDGETFVIFQGIEVVDGQVMVAVNMALLWKRFTEKGHIFVTVNLVGEGMSSIEVETNVSAMNTLSGFPVADRRCGWGGFKTLNKEDPPSTQNFSTSELINLIVSVEDTGVGIPFEAQSSVP
ncbi:histidine kinase 3-like, partial [Thalictrum thalictroides]